MGVEDKDIYELSSTLDYRKLFGRYIHYGNVIHDYFETKGISMAMFFGEVYNALRSILTEHVDDEQDFKNLKWAFVMSIRTLVKNIKKLTPEIVKKQLTEAVEHAKNNLQDFEKFKSENSEDFFL